MESSSVGAGLAAPFPNERVAAALVEHRARCGMSRRLVAGRSGIDSRRLKSYELGRARIPDRDLLRLAALYEVEVCDLLPPRAPLDFDPQRSILRIGGVVRKISDPGAGSYAVLKEYLGIIYELRNTSRLERLPLREVDLDALAGALGREPEVIERRLMELMDCSHQEAVAMRRVILRRRLVTPAAGLMIGAGVLGGVEVGTGSGVSASSERGVPATNEVPSTSSPDDRAPAPVPGPSLSGEDHRVPATAPRPEASEDDPAVDDVQIGTAIVQEQGDDEPTVREGDEEDAADEPAPEDVEIGTAIVQEHGDDEPTVRE